jgi:uncharacterized protein (TIGR02118 family)
MATWTQAFYSDLQQSIRGCSKATFSNAHIIFNTFLLMIQLNILYPKTENARFDWDYYLNTHMPMSIQLHGAALKGTTIAKGIEGIEAAPVAYVAVTNMLFESVESFLGAFMPHAETLQGDMNNYTNIQPVIQFSEVVLQHG